MQHNGVPHYNCYNHNDSITVERVYWSLANSNGKYNT